jgi:hypothetical protein
MKACLHETEMGDPLSHVHEEHGSQAGKHIASVNLMVWTKRQAPDQPVWAKVDLHLYIYRREVEDHSTTN